jgi:hypothetical protein
MSFSACHEVPVCDLNRVPVGGGEKQMSSDGPGNFDSDTAYDTLGFLLDNIADEIRQTFKLDSEKSLYGDLGEGRIMANIDIVLTLCDHYKAHPSLDDPDEIIKWKQDYLNTFDRTIEYYRPSPGFTEKRRKVIGETFDKLYQLVKEMNED